MKNPFKSNKGEMVGFVVSGIIGFIIVAVILYVMFPIFGGVVTATTPANATASWGPALAAAQANNTANVAAGSTLAGIAEIVIAAVLVLGVLLIGLVRQK